MIDMTNQKFNKLTVIKFDHYDKKYNSYWLCKCECGNYKVVRRSHLLHGNVQSCGCVILEGRGTYKNGWRTHGLWHQNPRLCKIWNCMKDRCYNKDNEHYKDYGGRNIKICEEWKNDFANFVKWAKNNGYEEHLTIDRIDVNGDYCPDNCRWATRIEQANNKRNNIFITYRGETNTIAQWSRRTGISEDALERRYHKGWKEEYIFSEIKGFSPNRTFLTFKECTKSLTWWSKKLQIKPEKLKKLLDKESFEKICIDHLTLDKELNIL